MENMQWSQDLDKDWKRYFDWSLVYPAVIFFIFTLLAIILGFLSFTSHGFHDALGFAVFIMIVAIPVGIFFLGYCAWYIFASNQWFKIFKLHLIVWNVVNVILLLCGLHFFTVFYLYFKMKEIKKSSVLPTQIVKQELSVESKT